MNNATVTVLWIGENKPDFFSKLIQICLRTDYSHNALIFDGVIWHGTTGDGHEGFCSQPIAEVLANCTVRYCRRVITRFSTEELRGYLEGRRGTPYALLQNLGAVRPVLFDWPIVRMFFRNGRAAVNCSEVVAEVCQGGLTDRTPLDFGDADRVKPTDTFRVIFPEACRHNHSLG